jgi:hypothetical protein
MICLFVLIRGAISLQVPLILGALFLLVAGIMLFRFARSVEAESGRRAMVDVFASVLGVSILTLLLLSSKQHCGPVLFLTLYVVSGILSAAVFRRVSQ